jgi:prepilin-type N-terminal cleavage/methylation domain-containing protein
MNTARSNRAVGFTLIELLVTVALVTILSGVVIAIINPGGMRAKARDGQRIADLKRVQTALELYFSDNRRYPDSAAWAWPPTGTVAPTTLTTTYIDAVPSDPTQSGTGCGTGGYSYQSNGTTYMMSVHMEVSSSATPSPCSSINMYSCNSAAPCYGVKNP